MKSSTVTFLVGLLGFLFELLPSLRVPLGPPLSPVFPIASRPIVSANTVLPAGIVGLGAAVTPGGVVGLRVGEGRGVKVGVEVGVKVGVGVGVEVGVRVGMEEQYPPVHAPVGP